MDAFKFLYYNIVIVCTNFILLILLKAHFVRIICEKYTRSVYFKYADIFYLVLYKY